MRPRNIAVLVASLAAHVALLVAWMNTRPELKLAESPTIEVQLVRPPRVTPPPKPRHPLPAAIRPAHLNPEGPPPTPPLILPLAPRAPAGPRALSDEELLSAPRPTARQLRDAPISSAVVGAGPGKLRPCNPQADHPGEGGAPCLKADDRAFAAEAYAKGMINSYKGSTSTKDYPSLRCVFLHKHCKVSPQP